MQTEHREIAMINKVDATTAVRPRIRFSHEDSALAKYLTKQIEALSSTKSQREIAAEMGYDKPNIISMFKRGETKVPLDRIPSLAKALHVDPAHLFRLALEQHNPEISKVIDQVFGNVVTDNEMKVIKKIRDITHNTDPSPPVGYVKKLEELYGKSK